MMIISESLGEIKSAHPGEIIGIRMEGLPWRSTNKLLA
jgi:hypothetical protein